MKKPYFIDEGGNKVPYVEVAEVIKARYPLLRDKHIFVQLEGLGMLESFRKGETPHSLPYSFSDYELTINLERI